MAQQTERPRDPGRRQTLDGSSCVLAEYDRHGRIRGGEPEQMVDAAAAAYLALSLDGTDTLLMAADHALRRELSRRVRGQCWGPDHLHPERPRHRGVFFLNDAATPRIYPLSLRDALPKSPPTP